MDMRQEDLPFPDPEPEEPETQEAEEIVTGDAGAKDEPKSEEDA